MAKADKQARRAALVEALIEVLTNPETPQKIYEAVAEEITDLVSDINETPEVLRVAIPMMLDRNRRSRRKEE